MDTMETGRILKIMEMLMQCEESISDFYLACAGAWPEERDFWRQLAGDEIGHAVRLRLMAKRVQVAPWRFRCGRVFHEEALRTFVRGAGRLRDLVAARAVDLEQALVLARDLERSLIERKVLDTVESTDRNYRNYLQSVLEETVEHGWRITRRLEERQAATAA